MITSIWRRSVLEEAHRRFSGCTGIEGHRLCWSLQRNQIFRSGTVPSGWWLDDAVNYTFELQRRRGGKCVDASQGTWRQASWLLCCSAATAVVRPRFLEL
jgi:hypothetical protein